MLKLGWRWRKKWHGRGQVRVDPCFQHRLLLLWILKTVTHLSISPTQLRASCLSLLTLSVNICLKRRIGVCFVLLVDCFSQRPWKDPGLLFKKKKEKHDLFSWFKWDLLVLSPLSARAQLLCGCSQVTEGSWGSPLSPPTLFPPTQARSAVWILQSQ